jgi:hypothetical protein
VIRALCLVAAAACSTDDGGPRLDSIAPTSVMQGAMAMLTGSRLCGAGGSAACANVPATIALGIEPPMVQAEVVSYTDTAATFVVPSIVPAGQTDVIVTVGDQSSNALSFDVLAGGSGQ